MENKKHRQVISKLCLSNHKLEIELGRYKTKNREMIPECQRICKLCDIWNKSRMKHTSCCNALHMSKKGKNFSNF